MKLRVQLCVYLTQFFLFALSGSAYADAITVTGVVRAEEEVMVRSEVAGIIRHIFVREGDEVREGQSLIELRNDRQKIIVQLTRAKLAKAKAALTETEVLLGNAKKELGRVQLAGDALPRKELRIRCFALGPQSRSKKPRLARPGKR
jgi:multidrug efflux pump subunit AcrA (membrane-fusion protein)